MIELAAYLACIILAVMAIFQIALAFGAPIGHFAWGGAHKVLPMKLRIGSLVAVILYGVFSVFILSEAGVITTMPEEMATVGTWVIAVYFALGIVMNALSRSKPERMVMTPVAAVLTALFLIVALG